MSIHVFGDTVEEVQRKLSEILPLVSSGADRVLQLHATLESELTGYQTSYENLESSISSVASEAAELGGEITGIQSEVESGINELINGLDEVNEQTETALQHLDATQERLEADLAGRTTELQAGSTVVESHFDTMNEGTIALQAEVNTLREQADTAFTEVADRVNEFASAWEQEEAKSQESLVSLKSAITENHSPEVKQKFDGFNASTVETVRNVVDLLTEKDDGLSDFFSAFDTDADALAESFKSKTREIFGELKDCAENECGKAIQESLDNLAKEVIEAFAAEVIASAVTTQLGVATTGALAPIIPELVIAKKVTGVINSIL